MEGGSWVPVEVLLPSGNVLAEVLCSDGKVRDATYVRYQQVGVWLLDQEDDLPESVMVTHWRIRCA